MSLLLVEQSSRGRNVDEQREIAALALTAGCIAQAAAESRTLLNPEEAFVCASLRNFGRIVMVTCMLDDYRAAQALAQQHPTDDAFRQIFGLTPLELGHRLLEASELPAELLATLRTVAPDTLATLKPQPVDQMLGLTDFAAQLAEMALQSDLTAAAFADASKKLAQRYATILPDLADQTLALVDTASQQLNHFVRTLRLTNLPPRMLARLRNRADAVDPAGSLRSAPVSPASASPNPASSLPTTPPSTTPERANSVASTETFSWSAEIQRLAALAASHPPASNALLEAAIDSLTRGLRATECLLFSRQRSDDFTLTHGRGPSFHHSRQHPVLHSTDRTAFGVCLARAENVLIHRAADPKLAPYLPSWLPPTDVLGAFVLFPLINDGRTHGLVLAGWSTPRQIALAPEDARLIRQLLATALAPRTRAAA